MSGVKDWRDLRRTCVSGMARLGIPPHVADKILNHQTGTGREAIKITGACWDRPGRRPSKEFSR